MNYKNLNLVDSYNKDWIFSFDNSEDIDGQQILPIDFQEYSYSILTVVNCDKHNFNVFLKAINKYPLSQENIQFILEGCKVRLIESEEALRNSTKEHESNDVFFQEIIFRIIIILDYLSRSSMEIKNTIVDNISLDKIIEFTINFPNNSIQEVSSLFLSLLNVENEEDNESNCMYLSKFVKFFPLFEKLYIEMKNTHLIKILNIFIFLAQVPSFFTYFNKKIELDDTDSSIIDDIMNMIDAHNNKILIRVLFFSYLIIKMDIEKALKYIDRYTQLLGKGSINGNYFDEDPVSNVVCWASKIIRYIIKYEVEWIPANKLSKIAIQILENAKNSKMQNKVIFLKCLFTLTEKCDLDYFNDSFWNSFGAFLAEFLDFEYDNSEIILSILDEVNILIDKEIINIKTNNFLFEFLNNGGYDFLQNYSTEGDNPDIVDEIKVIMQKVDLENYTEGNINKSCLI